MVKKDSVARSGHAATFRQRSLLAVAVLAATCSCRSGQDRTVRAEVITRYRANKTPPSSSVRYEISLVRTRPVAARLEVVEPGREAASITLHPDPSWREGSNGYGAKLIANRVAIELFSALRPTSSVYTRILEKGDMKSTGRYVSFDLTRRVVIAQLMGRMCVWPFGLADESKNHLRRYVGRRFLTVITCTFEEGLERLTGRSTWSLIVVDYRYADVLFKSCAEGRFNGPRSSSVRFVKSQEEMSAVIRKWIEQEPGLAEAVPWMELRSGDIVTVSGRRRSQSASDRG